jgi:zinc transporter
MEEMGMQATEELNRRIYLFTVIAGIFMPLTFLASLLGMNVAGIPMADHPMAFYTVFGLMAALGVGIWQILRSNRWL